MYNRAHPCPTRARTHTHTHTHAHARARTHAGTHQGNPIKFSLLCTDSIIASYPISVPFLSFT